MAQVPYDARFSDANQDTTRYVIKRNGSQAEYAPDKIRRAIILANTDEMREDERLTDDQIEQIVAIIDADVMRTPRALGVEEIQDRVEREICKRSYNVFMLFHDWRMNHARARNKSGLDAKIEGIIDVKVHDDGTVSGSNEEVKQENSNKNPTILSVQRDYIAGEWCRHYIRDYDLPEDVVEANDQGIIHFHDMDYSPMQMTNCCLVNLNDMLQNGTMISGTMIEKPKSFSTACTVASQIAAAVASTQYGGQTMTLSHLAPFVNVSRQKIRREVEQEFESIGFDINNNLDKINSIVNKRLLKEIESGCQTIQYQLVTLHSTNGQAPFITIFMDVDEPDDEQTRDDLALIIRVMLEQRILGVKDASGQYIAPAFPKLIYALTPNNIEPGSKYYDLTRLAARCSTKRMVPDYISTKKMQELKGDTYPCMGCVAGNEVIDYKLGDTRYVESFERAWRRLSMMFDVQMQPNGHDLIINPNNMSIWDSTLNDYTPVKHMIRNESHDWMELTFSNGRALDCTIDHPFETSNGVKRADELTPDDIINIDKTGAHASTTWQITPNMAWLLGLMLCDGEYSTGASVTLSLDETDIANRFKTIITEAFGLHVNTTNRHRGVKDDYIELRVQADANKTLTRISDMFKTLFEGTVKNNRHLPNDMFNAPYDARIACLAGMIDADGYVNNNMKLCHIQIGSTNKELAIQQMMLAQSLGMPATLYRNHYRANKRDNIRYRVEFVPNDDLINAMASMKKKANMRNNTRTNASVATTNTCKITNAIAIERKDYSYDVTTQSEHFTVSGIYSHNCRSFLTPDRFTEAGAGNIANALDYVPGKHKYYGRFNMGVVTINLPDVALSAGQDETKFWKILDERLELCHKALRWRYEHLKGTPSDVAPILWQYGAYARLKHGETIDKLLTDGYATISLGYAGLYETVMALRGVSHTTPEGRELGLAIMQRLNDKCNEWKANENIDYSLYGTPMESGTYKFAKSLQKRFGVIENVSDHNYITNSYHVNVREEIDAFNKLTKEAEFQKLSPGGAVSYVEVPNMQDNIDAVMALLHHIYETILYAELNTKLDLCETCGYDGEIRIVEEHGKLIWRCPHCGNTDESTLHVVRRSCGYLGSQFWNQGRTQEIKDRVLHL